MPQSRVEIGPRQGVPRILVVEDEALIRFAIAEALRELAYQLWKPHQPTRLGNI